MRFVPSIIAIFIFIFSTFVSAQAETIMITTGEWAPYMSENLPGGGPVSEIITAAYKAEGIDVKFEYYPWKRAISLVETGKALGTSAWSDTEERRAFSVASDPMVSSREVFVYMKKNLPDFDYTNLEDLKKYKLMSLAGYSHEAAFQGAGLKTDSTNNAETALKKLELGRGDLMCENEAVMAGLIKKMYPGRESEFGMSKTAFNEQPLHLLFSKKFPDMDKYLKKFNSGLAKIKQDGTYDKIMTKLK